MKKHSTTAHAPQYPEYDQNSQMLCTLLYYMGQKRGPLRRLLRVQCPYHLSNATSLQRIEEEMEFLPNVKSKELEYFGHKVMRKTRSTACPNSTYREKWKVEDQQNAEEHRSCEIYDHELV